MKITIDKMKQQDASEPKHSDVNDRPIIPQDEGQEVVKSGAAYRMIAILILSTLILGISGYVFARMLPDQPMLAVVVESKDDAKIATIEALMNGTYQSQQDQMDNEKEIDEQKAKDKEVAEKTIKEQEAAAKKRSEEERAKQQVKDEATEKRIKDAVENAVEKTTSEVSATKQTEIDQLKRELSTAQSNLDKAKQELETTRQDTSKKERDLQTELELTQNQLAKAQAYIDGLSDNISDNSTDSSSVSP